MGGIRFEADGSVTIITGTLDYGQGHAAPFAQVLSEKLGVPFETHPAAAGRQRRAARRRRHRRLALDDAYRHGDRRSRRPRSIEQGKQIASHVLEASAGDIEFADGRFVIAGTDRSIGIMELAEKLRAGMKLPPDAPQSLDVKHVSEGAPVRLSQRLPCLRGRDRSRHRR